MEEAFLPYINTEKMVPEKDGLRQLISQIQVENKPLVQELNTNIQTYDSARKLLEKITGQKIDPTTIINVPFQTHFGRHITFGKNVYVNMDVFMTDLGGITIEDNVLIAPRAKILTVNHPLKPSDRHKLELKSVTLKKNCWIGADATIMPGVTVGENAVVAAGALVTKDVPADTLVAGIPAKVMKKL
ncbi:DapH/DapD/GlmU-related protein [Streptococcus thoraltensis]|uniref:DapH/DapD/GlmU-related protein n=1 Tax=Streptococcus thoraltensis TaxID=55085 RepID=UPI002A81AAAC|nr:DapH/DapD/GlmU-related protein [Streptococcus thoraltensis]MDY4761198.1 DapH/DapD/GlmU-related protein [Streptococcus thoraltensis]